MKIHSNLKFEETLKFSSLYRFIKENKEIYYQQEIPQLTCLCEKCENFELLCEDVKCSETSLKLLPSSVHAVLPKFLLQLVEIVLSLIYHH